MQVFHAPTGYSTAEEGFIAFLCDNIWAVLREKAKKKILTRLWKGKTRVFEAPTGYRTAEEGFIAFLCDNIWAF